MIALCPFVRSEGVVQGGVDPSCTPGWQIRGHFGGAALPCPLIRQEVFSCDPGSQVCRYSKMLAEFVRRTLPGFTPLGAPLSAPPPL